uniref:Trafficking protein particle complex subunit 12 n=1 Tax=Kalanchoe fedtschenkoi TaxID=63787 RepID=A0A7N0UZ40_KALFE
MGEEAETAAAGESAGDSETPTKNPTLDSVTNQSFSLNDLAPELSSLHDLANRGSWRSILDKVSRARKLSLISTYPHHALTYAAYYVLALTKLRKYDEVLQELSSLDNLDSSQYCYESYPDLYAGRRGSMVPFSLRWIHAQVPIRTGQRQETLDRLYRLLDFVRTKLEEKGSRNLSESVKMWRKRESFVISSIMGIHLSQKEFNVCLDLMKYVIASDDCNPVLLSKLGHIQMLLGDLEGAKKVFGRVEKLSDEVGFGEQLSEVELRNLVNRNKALLYMVAKDYVSAVREYDQCIERDGTDAVAINNKAICLMYLRDLSDSIKVLEVALEEIPTHALNETLVVNLCSMYELAFVNHSDNKTRLSNWIARVAPDDFDASCTRI